MDQPRSRRSFLTAVLTRAAGLILLAAGGAALASGCGPFVAKYGGPPEEDCFEGTDGGCDEETGDAGWAAKYGGPGDAGL